MATVKHGHVPANITIYTRKSIEVKTRWDDIELPVTETITAVPAFVVDSASQTRHDTGREWANRHGGEEPVEIPNGPFNLRLVGLEYRSEGGRAWKVIFGQDWLVDLREDVLLESLRTVGSKPGGFVEGQFVWAVVGSQTKLVRYESTLYTALLEAGERKQAKAIGSRELVVGGVYRQVNGDRKVYLGQFETRWISDINHEQRRYDRVSRDLRTVTWKGPLWANLDWARYSPVKPSVRAAWANLHEYCLEFRTSHPKVIEKIDQLKLTQEDVLALVRGIGETQIQKIQEDYDQKVANAKDFRERLASQHPEYAEREQENLRRDLRQIETSYGDKESRVRGAARQLNLTPIGTDYVDPRLGVMPPAAPPDYRPPKW